MTLYDSSQHVSKAGMEAYEDACTKAAGTKQQDIRVGKLNECGRRYGMKAKEGSG